MKFKAHKAICELCMDRNRIPLNTVKGGKGDSINWNTEDERRWAEGIVLCPQGRCARKPERRWCLCAGEMDAMTQGFIVIWEERREKSKNLDKGEGEIEVEI